MNIINNTSIIKKLKPYYQTKYGKYFSGNCEEVLSNNIFKKKYKGKINLIFTSPPFPLNKKKKYGNKKGDEYLEWLSNLACIFKEYLTNNGSIVIELGNSWEKGEPIMSTLPLKSLLSFLEKADLKLCQQFIWHNTAKLPTPAHWVTVKRERVKDSYTNIWWMSKTAYPKANNRKVLTPYSKGMQKLLQNKKYNHGKRPSEHFISKTAFLKNNEGAIPPNIIAAANTFINPNYKEYCLKNKLDLHPARMPIEIPNFFIKFLTEPNDIILDPFGGSNTTGEAAENLKRKWISLESNIEYIKGSKGRFIK